MIHVLVPRGATYPRDHGLPVKVHESRRFSRPDILSTWPPRVSVERALIDAASWSRRPRHACGVLAAGVQQGLTTPQRLLDELHGAGAVRFRHLLQSALLDICGGAQAMSEIDFLRFCSRNGLPRPMLQQIRRDSEGRRRYLDATFKKADGRLIRVEIDGALHLLVQTYWSDMARQNDLVIGHERVLRFPSYVIHANDPQAIAQLCRALDLSGPHDEFAA